MAFRLPSGLQWQGSFHQFFHLLALVGYQLRAVVVVVTSVRELLLVAGFFGGRILFWLPPGIETLADLDFVSTV